MKSARVRTHSRSIGVLLMLISWHELILSTHDDCCVWISVRTCLSVFFSLSIYITLFISILNALNSFATRSFPPFFDYVCLGQFCIRSHSTCHRVDAHLNGIAIKIPCKYFQQMNERERSCCCETGFRWTTTAEPYSKRTRMHFDYMNAYFT